eukprot:758079-Hanusia_phi.AAC.5
MQTCVVREVEHQRNRIVRAGLIPETQRYVVEGSLPSDHWHVVDLRLPDWTKEGVCGDEDVGVCVEPFSWDADHSSGWQEDCDSRVQGMIVHQLKGNRTVLSEPRRTYQSAIVAQCRGARDVRTSTNGILFCMRMVSPIVARGVEVIKEMDMFQKAPTGCL